MSDPAEPDWYQLPHDPKTFFGLPEEYDRKDLKRRYNKLIRVYKPEKHPDEFQQIRAAFEQLDNALRYGDQFPLPGAAINVEQIWAEIFEAQQTDPAVTAEPQTESPAAAILQQLQESRPQEVFRELKTRKNKTAYDYYALALLSDAVVNDDPLCFLRWLLSGLKALPEEPVLFHLLQAYFHANVDIKLVPKLLQATAKIVTNDRFYFLTEPLWDQLLKEAPFEHFAKLLAACEARIKDHRITGKLTFYLHIAKPAIWKADAAWLDRVYRVLEEHHDQIPSSLEGDVELLFHLRDYFQQRDQFLEGNSVRQSMDDSLYAFCTESEVESDRQFLESQQLIAADADEAYRAFQIGSQEHESVFLLWSWLTQDVGDRLGLEFEVDNEDRLRSKVHQWMRELDKRTMRSPVGWMWAAVISPLMVSFGCLIPVVAGLLVVIGLFFREYLTGTTIAAIAALAAAVLSVVLTVVAKSSWHSKIVIKTAELIYRRVWKRELLDFLQMTHVPIEIIGTIVMQLVAIDDQHAQHDNSEYTVISWLPHYLQQDFSLLVYSTALRFVV